MALLPLPHGSKCYHVVDTLEDTQRLRCLMILLRFC